MLFKICGILFDHRVMWGHYYLALLFWLIILNFLLWFRSIYYRWNCRLFLLFIITGLLLLCINMAWTFIMSPISWRVLLILNFVIILRIIILFIFILFLIIRGILTLTWIVISLLMSLILSTASIISCVVTLWLIIISPIVHKNFVCCY